MTPSSGGSMPSVDDELREVTVHTAHGDIIVDTASVVDPGAWNTSVALSAAATVHQTSAWADYYTRAFGARSWFLTARTLDRSAVAHLLVLETGWFHQVAQGQAARNWLKGMVNRFRRAFRWVDGPIVAMGDPNLSDTLAGVLLRQAAALALERGIGRVRLAVAPHVGCAGHMFASAFGAAGYEKRAWATYVVDLEADIDVLWSRIDRGSGRSAVRRAQRAGVSVRRLERREELEGLVVCEQEHARARGLAARPEQRWYALWDALRPHGLLQIFVAEHEGRAVGYTPVKLFNQKMHLIKPVQAVRHGLPVGDQLVWELICWGRAQGHRWFDLSGVSPRPENDRDRGIRHFKSKWGGAYVEYHEWSARLRGEGKA